MLPVMYVNGVAFDMRTPEGQTGYMNANHAKLQSDNALSLNNTIKGITNDMAKTASDYQIAHAGYSQTGKSLLNQAEQYANNYAVKGQNLQNSYGTNLAQIGSTYAAASPSVFQSSQAQDTNYANNQYGAGVQALTNERNTAVGDNYIQGVNQDGSLKLGTLGSGSDSAMNSTYGGGYNTNTTQEAAAEQGFNRYNDSQNNSLAVAKQGLAQNSNSQLDQTANTISRLDGYSNMAVPNFGTSNYQSTALPNVDLSKYTDSPLTAAAANGGNLASYGNFAVPTAVAKQNSQSSFLGYAPGSSQNGNLTAFLKASNTPGY